MSAPTPALTMARDRQILKTAAGLLDGTQLFHAVITKGLPEDVGESAERLAMASLELDSWTEFTEFAEPWGASQERMVEFILTLLVRDTDPDERDDTLDMLSQVCSNAINGVSLGGLTINQKTFLKSGRYQPAKGEEHRLRIAGTFSYLIDAFAQHNANPPV